MGQCNGKRPISLVYMSKSLITVITATDVSFLSVLILMVKLRYKVVKVLWIYEWEGGGDNISRLID